MTFRNLIAEIAEGSEDNRLIRQLQARLRRACHLGKKADHQKLQALAKEIFNDWDAVVAFVYHPELPPTNNEAERALRHAVIARQIGFGTRTREGSLAYSSLLSVIETCRLRHINPWIYIGEVLALARQGLSPPTISCWQLINGHGDLIASVPNFPCFFGGGNERLHQRKLCWVAVNFLYKP